MSVIKVGIIGMGYISVSHIDAIRRIGFAELAAVTDINYELAKKKSLEYNIPNCCKSVEEMLSRKDINVIHNCTPNNLHYKINEDIIKSGKHIFSEKPLTINSDQSAKLLEVLKASLTTLENSKILSSLSTIALDNSCFIISLL